MWTQPAYPDPCDSKARVQGPEGWTQPALTIWAPQGSPRILEWVGCPFSRGSSQPRNWTRVSCIAGRFLTSWATREALLWPWKLIKSFSNCSTVSFIVLKLHPPGMNGVYLSQIKEFPKLENRQCPVMLSPEQTCFISLKICKHCFPSQWFPI